MIIHRSWEQHVNDTTIFFEELETVEKNYLFSALASKDNAKLACHVYTDDIIINQIEYHIKEGSSPSEFLELLATLLSTVYQQIPVFKKTIISDRKKRKNAKKKYTSLH